MLLLVGGHQFDGSFIIDGSATSVWPSKKNFLLTFRINLNKSLSKLSLFGVGVGVNFSPSFSISISSSVKIVLLRLITFGVMLFSDLFLPDSVAFSICVVCVVVFVGNDFVCVGSFVCGKEDGKFFAENFHSHVLFHIQFQ